MPKYNLQKNILAITGEPLLENGKPLKIGETMALLLMKTSEGDTLRHYDLAVTVRKDGEIELPTGDVDYIKSFLKDKCANVPHEIKAPLLREILEQEKAQSK